ncbi:unnamed protein product [Cunninghamella blakesleeana]
MELNEIVTEDLNLTATELTRSFGTNQSEVLNIPTENPSHLFWVPASQHPEISPNEFERYLHTLQNNVVKKANVKRRRSVLSVSFTADDMAAAASMTNDNDIHLQESGRLSALESLENKKQLGRSNSLKDKENYADNNNSNNSLDEKASKTRKERLRRSMSLQFTKDLGNIPDFLVFDRNSTALDQSPVLVPKAQRPLSRRGARTKFQRSSSVVPSQPKLSERLNQQPYRHSDSSYLTSTLDRQQQKENQEIQDQQLQEYQQKSISTDTLNLYDATSFLNDSNPAIDNIVTSLGASLPYNNNSNHHLNTSPTSYLSSSSSSSPFTKNESQQLSSSTPEILLNKPLSTSPSLPILSNIDQINEDEEHQANKNDINLHSLSENASSSSSSSPPPIQKRQSPPLSSSKTSSLSSSSSSTAKKSSWSWSALWSDDKKPKNEQMLPPSTLSLGITEMKEEDDNNAPLPEPLTTSTSTPTTNTNKQKSKFSSFFSRKSSSSQSKSTLKGNDMDSTVTMMPPKDFQLNKINQQRLPLHIERTVYRLSHVKLANPRRPLRDQVIISNFMFWYLSIISQQQHQQNPNQPNNNNNTSHRPSPRTPQQIIADSKKKKRPMKKKSSNNNNNSSNNNRSPPQRNSSSPILNGKNNHPPLPPNNDKTLKQYMDGSKQPSTGFVIPENYLKPATSSNQQKQRKPIRQTSSSSDEEDDDEDDDDEGDDDDDDDDDENKNKKQQNNNNNNNNNMYNNKNKPQNNYNRYPNQHHHQKKAYGNNVPLPIYNKKTAIS